MPTLQINNGTVIDPSQDLSQDLPARRDIFVEDGRIVAKLSRSPDHTIDARGQFVVPGLIDVHVHLREPGDEEEETIASGAAAAVAGGFTTVCCMPNTKPALDNESAIEFILRESERVGLANVLPVGAITKNREGKELAEIGSMLARGAIAISDDGTGVNDASVMRKTLQYAKMFDALIMQHCEAHELAGGCMNGGVVSTALGLMGIPAEAEQIMIARDVILNRAIGCRYHVQHISSAFSVELVRRAKRDGISITAEVAPHHLLLTDESCRGYDTNFKMNPPLRTRADVDACIAGVVDGTIDILATDHAPHLAEEKELEFQHAPFGILGLETAVGLYVKALVEPGHITWPRLIDLMSTAPAKLIRSDRGTLQIGRVADITIIDPNLIWTVDTAEFRSKSTNSPFIGQTFKGRPTHTIVGGSVKWQIG